MQTTQKNNKSEKKKHRIKIIIIAIIVLLIPLLFFAYLEIKTAYLRSIAPDQIEELVNIVDLQGEVVHEADRDDGCSEYQTGWLGGGTLCKMSGEKFYTNSGDLDNNLANIDRELRQKGWQSNDDIQHELPRFHSENNDMIRLGYYNLDTQNVISLVVIKRTSAFTTQNNIAANTINELKQTLDNNEYLYGIEATYPYKRTEKRLFLFEF